MDELPDELGAVDPPTTRRALLVGAAVLAALLLATSVALVRSGEPPAAPSLDTVPVTDASAQVPAESASPSESPGAVESTASAAGAPEPSHTRTGAVPSLQVEMRFTNRSTYQSGDLPAFEWRHREPERDFASEPWPWELVDVHVDGALRWAPCQGCGGSGSLDWWDQHRMGYSDDGWGGAGFVVDDLAPGEHEAVLRFRHQHAAADPQAPPVQDGARTLTHTFVIPARQAPSASPNG